MKTMMNLKMSLEPLQSLTQLYQYYLSIKDQQQVHQEPAASSQGPAASANSGDKDSECSDEYSAQSEDSGRTVLCPDL